MRDPMQSVIYALQDTAATYHQIIEQGLSKYQDDQRILHSGMTQKQLTCFYQRRAAANYKAVRILMGIEGMPS